MKKLLKKSKYKFKPKKVLYTEKKPFLADKEIIFRSSGRAKVFNISHRMQVIALFVFAIVSSWSGYNYYSNLVSESIINSKDKELGETRDAYMDLMSDVSALQSNLKDVVASIGEAGSGLDEIKDYGEQVSFVEDKIKQIATSEIWIDSEKIKDKVTKKEALLQKEIIETENNHLRQKIDVLGHKIKDLQETVKGLESAEIAILEKISKLSGKEIEQIKTSLSDINKSLKSQKKYFNPLANIKEGEGGNFIPRDDMKIENKELLDKMSSTFRQIDLLDNYKNALKDVPLGKPVYKYWLSSRFGNRKDPFKPKISTHKGLDFGASKGSRISAPAGGKVVSAGFNHGGYGNLVVLDHGNGFTTKYAHMNKIYVKKGDKVEYNQAIGEVGNSGRSTGSHLHYEILYRGVNVDPLPFVNLNSYNAS